MACLAEIHLRDPFILADAASKRYWLYGTSGENIWSGRCTGFDAYTSADLKDWQGPVNVFCTDGKFWADENYWAPEVHFRNGVYYMLASFKAAGHCRATQILFASAPDGPFRPLSQHPITPAGWECLDGTLYTDGKGISWVVFCREWMQVGDGEMYAIPLSDDLRQSIGAPLLLFSASQAAWPRPFIAGEWANAYVTDGPFLYKTTSGRLLMLWSSHGEMGYTLGVSASETDEVAGPWGHSATPLYAEDGGHGMVFRNFDGRLLLALHAPNSTPQERTTLMYLEENGGELRIVRNA